MNNSRMRRNPMRFDLKIIILKETHVFMALEVLFYSLHNTEVLMRFKSCSEMIKALPAVR